jgi:adsorption protein B
MGDSIASGLLAALDRAVAEATLFAAVLFLIGGIDDLLVDLHWLRGTRARRTLRLDQLAEGPPLRLAVFVPAWDEHRVIAAMLDAARTRWRYPDYRIYVGCYPNDPDTIRAVADVAERDSRVRLVIGPHGIM